MNKEEIEAVSHGIVRILESTKGDYKETRIAAVQAFARAVETPDTFVGPRFENEVFQSPVDCDGQ